MKTVRYAGFSWRYSGGVWEAVSSKFILCVWACAGPTKKNKCKGGWHWCGSTTKKPIKTRCDRSLTRKAAMRAAAKKVGC